MTKFFINCDWGTTHFRLRLASLDSASITAEHSTDEGVNQVAKRAGGADRPTEFEAVLARGLRGLAESFGAPLDPLPVVISGMASSSIGWLELPYAAVPWRLDGSDTVWRELAPITVEGQAHRVLLLSGVRTPTDVMRGEETQALGLFQLESLRMLTQRAVAILPGTHSKHLQIAGGAVIDFQTFMTGELFDVLGRHSILRHSIGDVARLANDQPTEQLASFVAGVRRARDVPLSATLFQVRTRQLLDETSSEANRAFLSGVLIGSELEYLRQAADRDVPIVLAGAEPIARFYEEACQALGLGDRLVTLGRRDVDRLSALGQALVVRRLGFV